MREIPGLPPRESPGLIPFNSIWITLSSSVILFNKHLLDYKNFRE